MVNGKGYEKDGDINFRNSRNHYNPDEYQKRMVANWRSNYRISKIILKMMDLIEGNCVCSKDVRFYFRTAPSARIVLRPSSALVLLCLLRLVQIT